MHAAYPKTHFIAADGPQDWPEQFAIITAYATVWEAERSETSRCTRCFGLAKRYGLDMI